MAGKAKARVFVPLTKVDEEQRLVYGRITQEMLDKSGESMDYVSSKPLFEKWSGDIHTNSGGLSKGNVRVMHGLTAAGKLTELDFNDDDQGIDVCAKIVDAAEWEKCLEGVYTGFSVGGAYEKRWTETLPDGTKLKKFTARPNEVSLVDNPCVPSALFTCLKADGSEVEVEFQVENDDDKWPAFSKAEAHAEEPVVKEPMTAAESAIAKAAAAGVASFVPNNADLAAKATELSKAAGENKPWLEYLDVAREALVKAHNEKEGIVEAPAATTEGEAPKEAEAAPVAKGDTAPAAEPAEAAVVAVPEALNEVVQKWATTDGQTFEKKADAVAHQETLPKVELTDAQKLAKRLVDAVQKNDVTEGDFVIPEVEDDMDRLAKAMEAIEAGVEDGKPKMQKGMYTVSRFARMIGDMAGLTTAVKVDEGDESTISPAMKSSISAWADSFKDYADTQITNILAGIDDDTLSPCYDYYYACAKADGDDQLAKDVCSIIDERKADREEVAEKLAKAFTLNPTGDNAITLEKYTKLEGEVGAFKKIAEDAVAKIEELTGTVDNLSKRAMPRAPRGQPVGKGGESFFGKAASTEEERMEVLQEMLKTHGPDALATMMIKASHNTGGIQMGVANR